mgnify:CR=1
MFIDLCMYDTLPEFNEAFAFNAFEFLKALGLWTLITSKKLSMAWFVTFVSHF